MADWQRKLTLAPEWGETLEGRMTVQALASTLAERLKALEPFNIETIDNARDDLVTAFQDIAGNEDAGIDDFDPLMDTLYDWADQSLDGRFNGKKVCWIERGA